MSSVVLATVILALLAFAAIATVVVALIVRRVRRRRAPIVELVERPAPGVVRVPGDPGRGPPLPVVLVHGLMGFDRIGVPGAKMHYFRGIARHLSTLGCHAHAVSLPPLGAVPARAEALVAAIDALPHAKVDLVAHSLGGLDARYALARLGLDRRVRSLVTVGTPHRGTPLADLAVGGPFDRARRIIQALGLPLDALQWLSTEALARFNREVLDVPGVRYGCVVGGVRAKQTPVSITLMPAHAYLRRVAGANDGLVPVSSQYWGETIAEIEADHFAQIGWRISARRSFDALGLYAFVVARLGDAGPEAAIATAAPAA